MASGGGWKGSVLASSRGEVSSLVLVPDILVLLVLYRLCGDNGAAGAARGDMSRRKGLSIHKKRELLIEIKGIIGKKGVFRGLEQCNYQCSTRRV